MKLNKGIAISYLLLMLITSVIAFLYLNVIYGMVYAVVVVLIFVLFVFFWTQMWRTMRIVWEIDPNHPSVYWALDQFKFLIKSPFPKNKELRNNLLWLRIILLMLIICIGILVNFS